jgi:hypothetical protein
VPDEYDLEDGHDDWMQKERERERRDDDRVRLCRGDSADQVLVAVIRRLTEKRDEWWATGQIGKGYGSPKAQVYRTAQEAVEAKVGVGS